MKKNVLIRAGISVLIIFFLIRKVNFYEIINVLREIRPAYYILFLIPFYLVILLSSLGIYYFLRSEKIKFREVYKFKMISRSFSLFFPGQFGDFTLVPLLKNKNIPMGKSLAAQSINKIISLCVLMIFASYGLFIYFGKNKFIEYLFYFFVLMVIVFLLISSPVSRRFIRKYILRKYASLFSGFYTNFRYYLQHDKKALLFNFVSLSLWIISTSFIIMILINSFGYNLNLLTITSIQSIGSLSSFLPISLSGAGVRESIVVYLLYLAGTQPSVTTSILLVFLAISYLNSGIVMLIYSKEFSLEKVKKMLQS